MQYLTKTLGAFAVSTTLGFVFLPGTASAKTTAGTVLTSPFTLDYTVGGYAGPTVSGSSAPVVVSRVVDLDVVSITTAATVQLGGSESVHVFRVTNDGNDASAYHFEITDETTAFSNWSMSYAVYDETDSLIAAGQAVTPSTMGADITGDASRGTVDIAPGHSVELIATGTVPAGIVDGSSGSLALRAEALNPTSWLLDSATPIALAKTVNVAAATADEVATVLADGSSGLTGDTVEDGMFATVQAYDVDLIKLEISYKEIFVRPPSAPCDDSWNPATEDPTAKMIPSACIGYLLGVTNIGGSLVDGVSISLQLPMELRLETAAFNALSHVNVPGIGAGLSAASTNPGGPVLTTRDDGTGLACDNNTYTESTCTITISDGALDAGASTLILLTGTL